MFLCHLTSNYLSSSTESYGLVLQLRKESITLNSVALIWDAYGKKHY